LNQRAVSYMSMDLERRRKTAGIMSMVVGIPNLVMALAVAFGGIIASVLFGLIIFGGLGNDGGDNPLGSICLVLIIAIFIGLLIVAVILTVISVAFAILVSGQTIGGLYAFKGIHYGRSLALLIIGSIAAVLMGIILMSNSLFSGFGETSYIISFAVGSYEFISGCLSAVSAYLVIGSRKTFRRVSRKKAGKKG